MDLSETIETRPNGSTRSKDHTQMTLFLSQNENENNNFSSVIFKTENLCFIHLELVNPTIINYY